MIYKCKYETPSAFDDMIMISDGAYLIGLYFESSKDTYKHDVNCEDINLPIFKSTSKWLDIYFSGKIPNFTPKYKIENLSLFRSQVIDIMNSIPFGSTISYNDIAKIIAINKKQNKMSAQAVGGAVGWNPICIIIPCHRVVGSNGNLTGYGGGIKNKIALLAHEKNDMSKYYIPRK